MRIVNTENVLNPNTLCLHDVKPRGDMIGVKVIACVTGSYWYCAMGSSDWPADRVATEGVLVQREIAVALFPTLAELTWAA